MGKEKKTLEYYRRLPYTLYREPQQDQDGSKYWTAEYLELRGCKTDGSTESEAIANLQELFDEYVLMRLEAHDDNIPEPAQNKVTVTEAKVVLFREKMIQAGNSNVAEETLETKAEPPLQLEHAFAA